MYTPGPVSYVLIGRDPHSVVESVHESLQGINVSRVVIVYDIRPAHVNQMKKFQLLARVDFFFFLDFFKSGGL